MAPDQHVTERIPGYCALCVSRCGSVAAVENGRFVALEPDPSHPTGQALCAKGRAAPELVYHSDRLRYPLKRTRPKGDADPGWQRISWDEALELTAARLRQFCESQHRGLPSLRRRARDPEVELHPTAAAERQIRAGDWVTIETPEGRVRARARLNESLDPKVACGQHGWWQACPGINAPGYDPFGPSGANYNLIIGNAAMDPVSGSVPHRAYLCQIRRAD
jgi:anaerobic selenocysteine-containing dehydrogenase